MFCKIKLYRNNYLKEDIGYEEMVVSWNILKVWQSCSEFNRGKISTDSVTPNSAYRVTQSWCRWAQVHVHRQRD
jgi:hypothetical protein